MSYMPAIISKHPHTAIALGVAGGSYVLGYVGMKYGHNKTKSPKCVGAFMSVVSTSSFFLFLKCFNNIRTPFFQRNITHIFSVIICGVMVIEPILLLADCYFGFIEENNT